MSRGVDIFKSFLGSLLPFILESYVYVGDLSGKSSVEVVKFSPYQYQNFHTFLLGSGEPSEVDKGVLLRGSLLVKGGKTFDPEKQDPSDMDYHRVAEAMVDTRLRNLPDFCRDALKQVEDIELRERLEKEVPGLRFEELEVSGVKVWDEFRSRATAFHEKNKTQ
ncbi:hypothetical protein C8R42DRAFT_638205 [Lentinula raphanica]|nr:hypothetical protein C8R42DRAFT_638205 [Lentinula raphanica]